MLGKLAHYGLVLGLPWLLHGPEATLAGVAAYAVTQVCVCVGGGGGPKGSWQGGY